IAIAWDLLEDLGVGGLALELNTLGAPEDRARYRSELVAWLEAHREELDPDSPARVHTNPLRVLDSKNPATQELLAGAPALADALSGESHERFSEVRQGLEALGIPFRLNPRLVRGLDYYSHTAFEITSTRLGAQATVCGGGRYDGLVEQLGGSATPAIGWALGLERLVLLLQQAGDSAGQVAEAPQVYLVNRGEEARRVALGLCRELRGRGLAVELDPGSAAFAKQFRRADRQGAAWAVVLGEEEAAAGVARLKALRPGSEDAGGETPDGAATREALPLQQIPAELLSRMPSGIGVDCP
ncbi:MAG: histidine--tRNA ligase, partial [Synechococcus sp.]